MDRRHERRMGPFTNFEVREVADGQPPELVGYACVFNSEATIKTWFDSWIEEMAPGAFKKTLQENDIRALWNHDPNIVLGRNKAGTLELREDARGLHTVIRPPDNEWGRPVLDAVRRGDVTGMSIGFQVIKEQVIRPPRDSKEPTRRKILEARLRDVSPVTFPYFDQTEITARAQQALAADEGDVLLRASAMARRAQMGMELSADDLRMLAEAVAILESVREPALRHTETGGHSTGAAEGEPESMSEGDFHSAEARARLLQLYSMQILSPGGKR